MAVQINLKELYSTDSQSVLVSKLNFNLNQILSLGVGSPGSQGAPGIRGPIGPIGPTGPTGEVGSLIYGITPIIQGTAPNPENTPENIRINDILVTSDSILKKVSVDESLTGWIKITDFNQLIQNVSLNLSAYSKLTANSRIIKPRITSGIDLTNDLINTNSPIYPSPGAGQTYQTVLYNFNELNTYSIVLDNGAIQIVSNSAQAKLFGGISDVDLVNNTIYIEDHGLTTGQFITYSSNGNVQIGGLINFNNYYIYVVDTDSIKLCDTIENANAGVGLDLTEVSDTNSSHKLITYPVSPDRIFPNTANLLLYSFFNNTANQSKEFETDPINKGYKHQLELGSIDTLSTAYSDILSGSYVISPSFENLKIRKYRLDYITPIGTVSNPGRYFLRAEYDISSAGELTPTLYSPKRNSEQVWKINKAGTSQSLGTTLELKLTNSIILNDTESASNILIDGIFIKRNLNIGQTVPTAHIGVGFNPSLLDQCDVVSDLNIKIQTNSQTNNEISLNDAIKVKGNRLKEGLPFPTTQVPSNDPNTLDDYEEGTWIPKLYGNYISERSAKYSIKGLIDSCPSTSGTSYSNPASCYYSNGQYSEYPSVYPNYIDEYSSREIPIDIQVAKYIKIGKFIKCWVNFTINPSFNFISFVTGSNEATAISGTDINKYDLLYALDDSTYSNRSAHFFSAIGLTLPFDPIGITEAVSNITLSGSEYFDNFSNTILSGTFNKQYDTGLGISRIYKSPINITPTMYYSNFKYFIPTPEQATSNTDLYIIDQPVNPINPTKPTQIRIGRVISNKENALDYRTKPAALFYANREFNNVDTKRIVPVTAYDCLYSATVNSDIRPDGVSVSGKIRFQAQFEYETND